MPSSSRKTRVPPAVLENRCTNREPNCPKLTSAMKPKHIFQNKPRHLLKTSFLLAFLLNIIPLLAQKSVVVNLSFNGQIVESANTTVIFPDNQGSKAQINRGDNLISGTRLIIPYGTTLLLQSPGGRQTISPTNGNTMEYMVQITPKGENHTVKGNGAQIKSSVTKSVEYNYRVNNGRGTTSAARGTEFTFTDMSKGSHEEALIITEEGSIHIIDKIPVTIGGNAATHNKRNEPLTQALSRVQNKGDEVFTSSDQPLNYADYTEAIRQVSDLIYAIKDPEERADNLLFLGDLYMDDEQPKNAIELYHEAMSIFLDIFGEEDLYTLEAQLSLTWALVESGNQAEADAALNGANTILQGLEKEDTDILNYIAALDYIEKEDDEAYDAVCYELVDIYGLLGWVYELADDPETSNSYYAAMEHGCK